LTIVRGGKSDEYGRDTSQKRFETFHLLIGRPKANCRQACSGPVPSNGRRDRDRDQPSLSTSGANDASLNSLTRIGRSKKRDSTAGGQDISVAHGPLSRSGADGAGSRSLPGRRLLRTGNIQLHPSPKWPGGAFSTGQRHTVMVQMSMDATDRHCPSNETRLYRRRGPVAEQKSRTNRVRGRNLSALGTDTQTQMGSSNETFTYSCRLISAGRFPDRWPNQIGGEWSASSTSRKRFVGTPLLWQSTASDGHPGKHAY